MIGAIRRLERVAYNPRAPGSRPARAEREVSTLTNARSEAEAAARSLSSGLIGLGGSMFRFSWALSVLGAQQAANLIAQSASGQPPHPSHPLDAVTNAVEEQFGGVFRGAYRTGREYLPGSGGERPEVADSKA